MPAKTSAANKPRSFRAYLERMQGNLGWVIARVPFDVKKAYGSRSHIRVKLTIGGQTFATSLFPVKNGGHFILVNKKMQNAGKVGPGQEAQFKVELETQKREVKPSAELAALFKQEKSLAKWYESKLSASQKREIARWIGEGKTAASRAKRADELAERLLKTMEAERELAPMIRRALAEDPAARERWYGMTEIQRRNHLMGIFYYKTPEAIERRMRKALGQVVE